jgi:hypothetical protein
MSWDLVPVCYWEAGWWWWWYRKTASGIPRDMYGICYRNGGQHYVSTVDLYISIRSSLDSIFNIIPLPKDLHRIFLPQGCLHRV